MSRLIIDSTPVKGEYWAEKGYNIVPIDVLRATSTIAVALYCNAEEVIPCSEVEEAQSYKNYPNTVLAGERKGEIIPGFDYTNSPYDLSQVDLTDKKVVLTTSDGTKLITKASGAEKILVASTLNYEAVAQAILGVGGDWALIGAGSSGDFRPEDKVGCALLGKVLISSAPFDISNDDFEFIVSFSTEWQKLILSSLSTQKLKKIGREIDVEFVIDNSNSYPIVPEAKKIEQRISITPYEQKK